MILVDAAVGSKELAEPLRAMGLEVDVLHLDSGDIAFQGRGEGGHPLNIGIEYKKLGELVQSLRTERLQGHQLPKMQQAYDFRWLLIEGELTFDQRGNLLRRVGRHKWAVLPGRMTVSELYKRLLVLQFCGGLTPWFTHNRASTLKFIEALYRCWTDVDLDQHKSHIAIYTPRPLSKISQFRETIKTLPGIGLEHSLAAEHTFGGSLRQAFGAGPKQWASINGVGAKTIHKIQEAIR